jgi:hypothetical protein
MYRRKRPLSKAAYAIAKTLDRDARDAKFKDNVTSMAGAAGGAPATIFEAMAKRRDFITQMGGFGAYGRRRKRRYGGRGGYIGRGGFFKKADKFLRGNVGRTLTRAALPMADAYTGGMASQVASAAGYGAYYNGLFPNDSTAVVPSFDGGAQDETGGILFSNKEYLGSITATNAFDNTSWKLNPGLAETFPFLSQIAANYQEYAFVQLAFVFKTQLSDVSSTGAIGSIIMCHNQNSNEPPFKTKSVMLQKIGSISEVPTRDIVCGIECDPNKIANTTNGGKYTRIGSVPEGAVIDQYDWGTFQLATDGMPVANEQEVQGELWVSYTVYLRQPILFTATGKAILGDVFQLRNLTDANTNDVALASPRNTIGCGVKIANVSAATLTNPRERYIKVTFPPEMLYKVFEVTITFFSAKITSNTGVVTDGWYPSGANYPGPTWFYENCQRQTQIEASKYAYTNQITSDPSAIPNQQNNQRANYLAQNGNVFNNTANYQYSEPGLFSIVVALDGTFGSESYVKWDFTSLPESWSFTCSQVMIHISQIKPDFTSAEPNDVSNYFDDWITVQTRPN